MARAHRNHNAMKTRCPHGHGYTPGNTVWTVDNGCDSGRTRRCRECARYLWRRTNWHKRLRMSGDRPAAEAGAPIWTPLDASSATGPKQTEARL